MHGKTKSFFEDASIIIVVLVSIYGLYYLYSNYNSEEEIAQPIAIVENVTPNIKSEIKVEPKIVEKEPIKKDLNATNIIEEKEEKLTTIKEVVIKKEKNVDLKILRSFLIETQFRIRKNMIYPSDINKTKTNRFLKIKITILKNGNYEQLKFIDGNKEMFDLNKENILKLFPLTIDEKIVDEFPRYFRMSIK